MRRGERRAGKLFRDRVKQIFKEQNFPYVVFCIENCSPQPPRFLSHGKFLAFYFNCVFVTSLPPHDCSTGGERTVRTQFYSPSVSWLGRCWLGLITGGGSFGPVPVMEEENNSGEDFTRMKMNINSKLSKYKTVVAKKVGSLKDESKEKSEAVRSFLKEESAVAAGVTKIQKMTEELLKNESETEEENSESKFRKLTSGLGKKIKDIKEDIVDMKGESLQSLNDLKELYYDKAEQKKAILNSFTEEEVKVLRRGAQIPSQVTKQMNALYLAKRLSIVR